MARILLGDTSDDHPMSLLDLNRPRFIFFLDAFAGDIPLVSLNPVIGLHR